MMKKMCLCLWAVLWFCSCGSPWAKESAIAIDTAGYPYKLQETVKWRIDRDPKNLKVVLNALKSYETGDTATLCSYLAKDPVIYYDRGVFKGHSSEFMYAIKAKINELKQLRFTIKVHLSQISADRQQARVITWYTQSWINEHGEPDSADIVDDARLKGGKIVEWYDLVRRYKAPSKSPPGGETF